MIVETTDQLRIAIDRGFAGDKVDFPDPAAAPLGTDDEAAGTPNTREQVRLAAHYELEARPNHTREADGGLGPTWWLVGYAVVFVVLIVAGAIWTRTL